MDIAQEKRRAHPGFEPGTSRTQSERHSASAAVKCKKRAQATGLISEKLDFVVPVLP